MNVGIESHTNLWGTHMRMNSGVLLSVCSSQNYFECFAFSVMVEGFPFQPNSHCFECCEKWKKEKNFWREFANFIVFFSSSLAPPPPPPPVFHAFEHFRRILPSHGHVHTINCVCLCVSARVGCVVYMSRLCYAHCTVCVPVQHLIQRWRNRVVCWKTWHRQIESEVQRKQLM